MAMTWLLCRVGARAELPPYGQLLYSQLPYGQLQYGQLQYGQLPGGQPGAG